jgi:hypothetical protein
MQFEYHGVSQLQNQIEPLLELAGSMPLNVKDVELNALLPLLYRPVSSKILQPSFTGRSLQKLAQDASRFNIHVFTPR